MARFLAVFGRGILGGRRSGVKEISVGKSDLVSAKNFEFGSKTDVFGILRCIFGRVGQVFGILEYIFGIDFLFPSFLHPIPCTVFPEASTNAFP